MKRFALKIQAFRTNGNRIEETKIWRTAVVIITLKLIDGFLNNKYKNKIEILIRELTSFALKHERNTMACGLMWNKWRTTKHNRNVNFLLTPIFFFPSLLHHNFVSDCTRNKLSNDESFTEKNKEKERSTKTLVFSIRPSLSH